eukprot:CAMPEP_0184685158 /NCGR_PEP_ID=MMETSP0312-20130426/17905_1 /TAXON_ID=31354 /ORGANISM="Compsopogon coeruleus, Strain SAG 36.94" /LENGTH=89 /DNA_ID=CAMNT_0027138979 /DNA_START=99 /DNA_END=364 /DNA_ORIENTATION=-
MSTLTRYTILVNGDNPSEVHENLFSLLIHRDGSPEAWNSDPSSLRHPRSFATCWAHEATMSPTHVTTRATWTPLLSFKTSSSHSKSNPV